MKPRVILLILAGLVLASVLVWAGRAQRSSATRRDRAFEAVKESVEAVKQDAQLEQDMQRDAWGNPLPRQPQDDPDLPAEAERGFGP